MSLFTIQDVASLRTDRLALLGSSYFAEADLGDDYLLSKLQAAETDAQLRLRVFLEPTEVLPEGATQEERDALDEAGTPWVEEPGYDLDPGFFQGDRWGMLITRHRPIIAVHSMRFTYPQPVTSVFTVPSDWIRLDRKYGQLQMVPGSQSFSAPISAWAMQVMGAGRTLPHMIQLRYRAGLTDVEIKYPNLITTIKRMAVLSVLQDAFLPQSGSISGDGLSQSKSLDLDKYKEGADASLDRIRDSIHGIRCMVV